jgi:hypothetical protein
VSHLYLYLGLLWLKNILTFLSFKAIGRTFLNILWSALTVGTRIAQSVLWLGCGLDDLGFRVRFWAKSKRFFSSLQHPDWLWGSSSPLSSGYQRLHPQGWSSWTVNLSTHLHCPMYLCGVVWCGAWLVQHRVNVYFRPIPVLICRTL